MFNCLDGPISLPGDRHEKPNVGDRYPNQDHNTNRQGLVCHSRKIKKKNKLFSAFLQYSVLES